VDFPTAFGLLIGNEGGYSNDPADPGGETMYGVTARVARANGYTGAMKDLQLLTAQQIAKAEYWDKAHCDEIPDGIRFDVFDTAYNSGVHEAIVLVQRTAGTPGDGYWGPATQATVAAMDPERCRRLFAAERLAFYTLLPGWDHDGRGWANRIAENLKR
jgi:lysozyme family protein